MSVTLEYAPDPPSRRIRVTRHDDGITVQIPRRSWRATLHVLGDFAEGGPEGCLLLLLAPLLLAGAIYWGIAEGFSYITLLFLLLGLGVVTFALVRLNAHGGGPELAVRGGRVTFRDTKIQDDLLRACDAGDVVAVLPGEGRPIIRTRGGNDLLGGYDAIDVDGYRELDSATKCWVVHPLSTAIGLPNLPDSGAASAEGLRDGPIR